MTLALAIVTSWSPAISRAVAIAVSTPSTKVVFGHRSAASAGTLWVTTTTAAPVGWESVTIRSARPSVGTSGHAVEPPSAEAFPTTRST